MTRRLSSVLLSAALLLAGTATAARPVAIGGMITSPRVETKTLPSGLEGLPVWFLPRLGVDVVNQSDDIRLRLGTRELRFTAATGWQEIVAGQAAPRPADLPMPELMSGSVHVSLHVLRALLVPLLNDSPEALDFGVPSVATAPAAPMPPVTVNPTPLPPTTPQVTPPVTPPTAQGIQLATIRSSITMKRALEFQRVVLELSGPAAYQVERDARGLSLVLTGVGGAVGAQKLESGDTLTVTPGSGNLHVRLDTGSDGKSEVFTLEEPHRIVIDTVTNTNANVPPPPDLENLPAGVAYRQLGRLHLLSFDPAQYSPKVVTAPVGQSGSVYDYVKRTGAVAGVNGGYFDPRSSIPVDLVAQGGLMLAPSLERRGSLGFKDDGNILFGFPRPRYSLTGAWGTTVVNTVGSSAKAPWVTLFVGDGRTSVGASGMATLILDGRSVVRAHGGPNVPGAGEIAVTFDPARFPQLPTTPGASVQLSLNWAASGWDGVREALSAGPLLVDGGKLALDPRREGFDTSTNVWRPTRQVAFAVYQGRPTIAYLESGSPEDFAAALLSAGVERALRLDSGSSATVYVAGGYFNTVWSRPVPNAIVFVPKTTAGAKGR